MNKWLIACMTLLAALFLLPVTSFAQVKYVRIKVVSAKLWPTKAKGKCWDPCWGKRYKLPPRGAKVYDNYFKNANFKTACTGRKAPDALVKLTIGRYEEFVTDKMDNTCTPSFNVSKVFRITPKDKMKVSVLDNDGAAGVRVKTDVMGERVFDQLPKEILNGGRLVLRGFDQVEELVLEATVVKQPSTKPVAACPASYRVRIVETEVKTTKQNGKTWDWKWAGAKPDLQVKLTLGSVTMETKGANNTFSTIYKSGAKKFAIKKGTVLRVLVKDNDPKGFDKIGEKVVTDVCSLIKGNGRVELTNFDQVIKVVLLFERQ